MSTLGVKGLTLYHHPSDTI